MNFGLNVTCILLSKQDSNLKIDFFFYISFTYEVAKRKCLTVTGDELKMVIVPTFYRQKCGNKQFHRRQPPQKDNYSKKK